MEYIPLTLSLFMYYTSSLFPDPLHMRIIPALGSVG